jgi:hypothetical protein
MVRGKAKAQAQERNAKNKKDEKGTQRFDAAKKLTIVCPICKAQMPSHKLLQGHYDSKHPKDTCPPCPE